MTLTQGHRDGCQKLFPHPKVNHVWFEEISFRGFPGKLKSVGRTAAVAEMAAARDGGGNGPKTISPPVALGDLIRTLGTNSSEILSEIHTFLFKKMHLKMSSAKWQQICLGLKVLTHWPQGELSNSLYRIVVWVITVKLLTGECHRTTPMRSQRWFK